jgi:transcriptional regulator with XRE-family HTH domain
MVGVQLVLKAARPVAAYPDTLGGRLRKRRLELGLTQREAGERVGVRQWIFGRWEADAAQPLPTRFPAIIRFLGIEPWDGPQTLGEKLIVERRRRGLLMRQAAALLGVDEDTLRQWERGRGMPREASLRRIGRFLEGLPPI